ncbi:MAG: hypothetical protein AAF944_27435 [Bacteroidota bacterium]
MSQYAGIGFGVAKDYGVAKVLYVKRGYIPDGNGIVVDSKPLKRGEEIVIDDSVAIYLVKNLQ